MREKERVKISSNSLSSIDSNILKNKVTVKLFSSEYDYELEDIPADHLEKANKYRELLVESAVEQDEALMEKYLNGEEISEDELKSCIRKATISGDFVPVLNGTAFKNKGVQTLLDAVVDFMPSPVDIKEIPAIDLKTEENKGGSMIDQMKMFHTILEAKKPKKKAHFDRSSFIKTKSKGSPWFQA